MNITLLTDNSIYYSFSYTKSSDSFTTPKSVYDRKFSDFSQASHQIKLSDVLTMNADPFYFEIHDTQDPTKIFFSSKDNLNIFHSDITVFTLSYPSSSLYFYGLAESSKDTFYLEDKKTYHLFASNEEGKNGFYPVLYSAMVPQGKATCVWTITSTP